MSRDPSSNAETSDVENICGNPLYPGDNVRDKQYYCSQLRPLLEWSYFVGANSLYASTTRHTLRMILMT